MCPIQNWNHETSYITILTNHPYLDNLCGSTTSHPFWEVEPTSLIHKPSAPLESNSLYLLQFCCSLGAILQCPPQFLLQSKQPYNVGLYLLQCLHMWGAVSSSYHCGCCQLGMKLEAVMGSCNISTGTCGQVVKDQKAPDLGKVIFLLETNLWSERV